MFSQRGSGYVWQVDVCGEDVPWSRLGLAQMSGEHWGRNVGKAPWIRGALVGNTKGGGEPCNLDLEMEVWEMALLGVSFSGRSDSKESACNAEDLDSIPGLGRSPGGGHGNPFQYSCLENPM